MKGTQNLLVAFVLGALIMSFPVFGATSEVCDYLNSTHSELDPEVQAILEQVNLEALEQQVAALGLGEGDQLVAVISEEGELLELGALEVQVALNTEQLERFAAAIIGANLGALLVVGVGSSVAGGGSVAIVTTALGLVPIGIMLVLVVKGIGD